MAELPYTEFQCYDPDGNRFFMNVELVTGELPGDEPVLMASIASLLRQMQGIARVDVFVHTAEVRDGYPATDQRTTNSK